VACFDHMNDKYILKLLLARFIAMGKTWPHLPTTG
jgi:hypothetical protein